MDMTSEWLGEMFEGDSADMCAGKFPLVSMGGPSGGSRVRRPWERGPPSALAEISFFIPNHVQPSTIDYNIV